MSFDTLLSFASRVEAAVASYLEVRDFTDETKWRKKFDTERVRILIRFCCRVSTHRSSKINAGHEFNRLKDEAGGKAPDLHPILIALFIVMFTDGDLGNITRNHPRKEESKYFNRNAVFPDQIAKYLPPRGERWWEDLGM